MQGNDSQSDSGFELEIPALEKPPEADNSPEAQVGLLLEADSLATISTRLTTAENLLSLLIKNQSFADFMREVLLSFLKAIKCEAGSILEADPDKKFLFFRASSGQSSDRLSDFVIPWGTGIVGHVAESRRPLLLQDTQKDPRYLRAVSSTVGFEGRNLMATPVVVRDRVFCVIELFNRVGKPTFDEQDLELMIQLSEMAGKAIEARLMINGARKSGTNSSESAAAA
ncbi:MAG: hypothetical protein RJB38_1438 [Pseudomonadota bacterium]|jgi:GAF domain-containing protein